jgi:hypothetical protein
VILAALKAVVPSSVFTSILDIFGINLNLYTHKEILISIISEVDGQPGYSSFNILSVVFSYCWQLSFLFLPLLFVKYKYSFIHQVQSLIICPELMNMRPLI